MKATPAHRRGYAFLSCSSCTSRRELSSCFQVSVLLPRRGGGPQAIPDRCRQSKSLLSEIFEHESPERKIDADRLRRLHQRRACARIAEDQDSVVASSFPLSPPQQRDRSARNRYSRFVNARDQPVRCLRGSVTAGMDNPVLREEEVTGMRIPSNGVRYLEATTTGRWSL